MKTRFAKWFAVSVLAVLMLAAFAFPALDANTPYEPGIIKRTQKCGTTLWQQVVCFPNPNWMTLGKLAAPDVQVKHRDPDECPPKKKNCAPKGPAHVQTGSGIQLARNPDQCPPKKKTCAPDKNIFGL